MSNPTELPDLDACPFCGGVAEVITGFTTSGDWPHGNFHRVFCGECQARQLFHRTKAEAINAWNRRPSTEGRATHTQKPALTVWCGPMPESNGKSNFTAILMRKGGKVWDGITLDRSEYPDRVRYEADRVRHLLGELAEPPCILDYDADNHSGYVEPAATLSPLCGAQHAESGKEGGLTIGEAFKAVGGCMNGGELGYPSFGSMDALRVYTQKMVRSALAAQQAAAPEQFCDANCVWTDHHKDCTISAPGTPEAPASLDLSKITSVVLQDRGSKSVIVRFGQSLSAATKFLDQFGTLVLSQRAAQLDGGQEGSESNG